MKINIKKIGLLLGLGTMALCQSCVDLEPEVYSKRNSEDFNLDPAVFESKLGDVYVNLQREYGYVYREGLWSLQENTTDECFVPTRYQGDWKDNGIFVALRNHEFSSKTREISQHGQGAQNNAWNFLSLGIAKCNDMLDWMNSIGADKFLDSEFAELYVLRAWYHYLMMDNFGNVPFYNRSGITEPVQLSRAAVCDSILKDLKKYVPLASEETKSLYSRVNKYTGYMILAKMYLNAEAWGVLGKSTEFPSDAFECYKKAAEYSDLVINSGKYSLEPDYFSNFTVQNQGSKENIWCVFYDANFSRGMQFHMMTLHYASQDEYGLSVQPWNGYCTSQKVIGLYEEGDKRIRCWERGDQGTKVKVPVDTAMFNNLPKQVVLPDNFPTSAEEILKAGGKIDVEMPGYFTDTLTTFGNNSSIKIYNVFEGARFVKFEIQRGVAEHMSNDFPIFRLADAYLMKAEASLRTGDKAAALEAANMVRARAGAKAYTDLTLDELSNERVRELCWEGHRRQDLIRFGRFTGPKSVVDDSDPSNLWVFRTTPSEDYKKIFPLPDFVIQNYGFEHSNPNYD